MTLLDVLLVLRDRLEVAYNKDRRADAEELMIIFDRLTELSYQDTNRALTSMLVDLTDTARDIAMGVKGKSHLPKADAIRAVLSTQAT